MHTNSIKNSAELKAALEKEWQNVQAYLPPTYTEIVHERLGQKYSRSQIRTKKSRGIGANEILIELIRLAKEERAKIQSVINS
jgi:hypothetical protein